VPNPPTDTPTGGRPAVKLGEVLDGGGVLELLGGLLYLRVLQRHRLELLELLELRRLQVAAEPCTDANPCGWCRADSWCGRRR